MDLVVSKVIPIFTREGLARLGELMRSCRLAREYSLDQLVDSIESITGHRISKNTISALERGNNSPTWDTLALLASAEYLTWPGTDELLTSMDMIAIACEAVIPGKPASARTKKSVEWSTPRLSA
jgi:transcriptional regulator with XRE-family HTH domain